MLADLESESTSDNTHSSKHQQLQQPQTEITRTNSYIASYKRRQEEKAREEKAKEERAKEGEESVGRNDRLGKDLGTKPAPVPLARPGRLPTVTTTTATPPVLFDIGLEECRIGCVCCVPGACLGN